jgi:hypothetical protein
MNSPEERANIFYKILVLKYPVTHRIVTLKRKRNGEKVV